MINAYFNGNILLILKDLKKLKIFKLVFKKMTKKLMIMQWMMMQKQIFFLLFCIQDKDADDLGAVKPFKGEVMHSIPSNYKASPADNS